ncbi:MAG: hypothetical protein ACI310_05500 [Bacilli bacterium]
MGILSLLLSVTGIVTMMFHYTNHSICLGIVTSIFLIISYILGTIGMKKQSKSEKGLDVKNFNPYLLSHGISSITLIIGGIMCIISNMR